MLSVQIILLCAAGLFVIAIVAVAIGRFAWGSRAIYAWSLVACVIGLIIALEHLMRSGGTSSVITLPLGLPWLGSHFRLDALSAFFLVLVNLGGAGASLYGMGYGQHENDPGRVLPFYPAFLAGMNLVVLADDAFTFLV
jgi:hydrogenase-4 component B